MNPTEKVAFCVKAIMESPAMKEVNEALINLYNLMLADTSVSGFESIIMREILQATEKKLELAFSAASDEELNLLYEFYSGPTAAAVEKVRASIVFSEQDQVALNARISQLLLSSQNTSTAIN